ncbi:hypothetical protein MLD38_038647 [Melastoma candidum]|uniref:Uncharacterized protein n=1 Tax=Melastoma candidum TaxID=119954 RepID=A0ACB9L121_9MYRT|nr:hypothetical protein MLD38_038647 [Melastoma candidum]
MEGRDDSSRFTSFPTMTLRNMSSSSSTFFSANQSPFFSPSSPTGRISSSLHSNVLSSHVNLRCQSMGNFDPGSLETDIGFLMSDTSQRPAPRGSGESSKVDQTSSTTSISNSIGSGLTYPMGNVDSVYREKQSRNSRSNGDSLTLNSSSLSSNRVRSCDVFIGLHGRKPSLIRFSNWLCAELECQGISCFMSDRARCRNSHSHGLVEKAMDVSSFGVVILTRKSFKNPYTIEELRFFSSKKNLLPIFFDLGPDDCLVRDIIEKRGELWEKHGGELWLGYGGLEKEWREAVDAISRADEPKLESHDGNWRDCILRAVSLLATKLGRRSVVERLAKWREKAEEEEFPFPRNESFIGRKKELSEIEFILFGDISGDSERDYFEIKTRPRRKNVTIGWKKGNSSDDRRKVRYPDSGHLKGKEPVAWNESEKEIEMHSVAMDDDRLHHHGRKSASKSTRRRRSSKILYGKGIACISGDSGIGKTELLLEFTYRYHQRYKMVLWIGGDGRYIRQNYLNLWPYLEVDVGLENCPEKTRTKSFEEHEDAAVSRIRKELMRNIPYLIVIDNLENEKDWWDHRLVMDLLPRFGGETHVIISTRLHRVMNLEPLKISYLSGVEAMQLMQGNGREYSLSEIDALRAIEEKVGRLTLALAIVGAILSELPITPSRLLDTINRMPLRELTWNGREWSSMRRNNFLLQLLEVCFSIFDHADRPRSLATRMVLASGWFAPAAIPVSLLALAAHKIPEKHQGTQRFGKYMRSLICCCSMSYVKRSEAEATSMLLRFNIARSSTKDGCIYINDLIKLYARKRGVIGISHAMVQAVIDRGSVHDHKEHLWAACFLLFGFGTDPVVVELKPSELCYIIKELVLPLAVRAFLAYSRCSAALELLRLCTDALEGADQALVTPVKKWHDQPNCWKPIPTSAQLNPYLWQELALLRATVLETRAKLMLKGGQYDIADDLIRKALYIRTSISGEDHPTTVASREVLSRITRLLANVQ